MDALKKELRKKIRELIKAQDYENRLKNGDKMADVLLNSSLWNEAESVFCFYSLPSEPSTLKIIDAALLQGKKLCLPKCEENGIMSLHIINSLEDLRPGAYGIMEPAGDNTVSPKDIDLALLPCLAASTDGSRLGKGGGYYDRFLQSFKGISVVLCQDDLVQENGSVPMDTHDVYAQYILTQTKLIKAKK